MTAHISRRLVLGAGAALSVACVAGARERPLITGVNLAGLEFNGGRIPGRLDRDFVSPGTAELDYFHTVGARAIRLPFRWERAQPELNGDLDETYLGLIDRLVEGTRARGMRIILDPHQYGRRRHNNENLIIGESAVTAAHFAQFWGTLASRYASAEHVIFGLQNEPHDQDTAVLVRVLQEAITAIRRARASQLILAPGNGWSGAHSWLGRGNAALLSLRDPADKMAFDAHQFLDRNSSGTNAACPAGAGGRLERFTEWARENRRRAFLSEFGGGPGQDCAREMTALLDYMAANRDVWIGWTYWAAGPWWPEDYPLSVQPASLRAPTPRPQLRILQRYFE